MLYGGRISYCLSLTHFLVLDVAFAVLWQDPHRRWVTTPKMTIVMPFRMLVAVGASAALYRE